MGLDFFAKTFLELGHVDVAGAEAGDLAFLSDFFELVLYAGLVVILYEFDHDDAFELAILFECYVHYFVFLYRLF